MAVFFVIHHNSVGGDIVDIRRLHVLDVPVVRSDNVDAVGVEGCPHPAADGHEDRLQVDVVTEDQPKAKHHLKNEFSFGLGEACVAH